MGKPQGGSDKALSHASDRAGEPVRVWCDGCFDLMHFGHANALRQAHSFGDKVVVGVLSDAAIAANKRPPVMTEEERYAMVRACKWVEDVVEDCPFLTSNDVLDEYGCTLYVHGDDVSLDANGLDACREVKASGRYREYPRTKGVSTTNIIQRLLAASAPPTPPSSQASETSLGSDGGSGCSELATSPYTGTVSFANTKMLRHFTDDREPTKDEIVGYFPGSFDVFNIGHVKALAAARQQCDYLIVGLYSDETVSQLHGANRPIMSMSERLLAVAGCRYVDNVAFAVGPIVCADVIEYFGVHKVFHGKHLSRTGGVSTVELDMHRLSCQGYYGESSRSGLLCVCGCVSLPATMLQTLRLRYPSDHTSRHASFVSYMPITCLDERMYHCAIDTT
eukprot:m.250481 g.250481  ORF g.250481 m.250481 type:complete len:393 (-) comp15438_c0_seq1:2485-3663(-)